MRYSLISISEVTIAVRVSSLSFVTSLLESPSRVCSRKVAAEEKTRKPTPLTLVLVPVILVALLALLTATIEHKACFHPGPPVDRPEPSTPRGEYCSAVNSADPWVSLTAAPVAVMAALALMARRSPWLVGALTFAVCAALIANAIVASSLTYSLTI